jgi:hypothetical protein
LYFQLFIYLKFSSEAIFLAASYSVTSSPSDKFIILLACFARKPSFLLISPSAIRSKVIKRFTLESYSC